MTFTKALLRRYACLYFRDAEIITEKSRVLSDITQLVGCTARLYLTINSMLFTTTPWRSMGSTSRERSPSAQIITAYSEQHGSGCVRLHKGGLWAPAPPPYLLDWKSQAFVGMPQEAESITEEKRGKMSPSPARMSSNRSAE